MENIDKIESAAIEIQGENVIITTLVTLTKDEYTIQLDNRMDQLQESKTSLESQLISVNQAISDLQEKRNQI